MDNYIVFDIGGTYVKYGVIGKKARVVELKKVNTPNSLEGLVRIIREYTLQHPEKKGIAVSLPGAVSAEGIIYGSSAVDYLHGPNIKQLLKKETGLSVYMENDANCAAYAEKWAGSAADLNDFIMMVIGTGIGGAIIKNGEVHKGANLHGGEFGLMLVSDDTEENGWVRMDSTASIIRNVADMKQKDYASLTGETIFQLADTGDRDCLQAIDQFYSRLAIGIYNLQYVYDPEVILIGGGISVRKDLIPNINNKLDAILSGIPKATIRPNVQLSKFRQHANLLGAVYGFIKEEEHGWTDYITR